MANTTRPIIRIHDIATNEIIDREMNEDEFAAYELQNLQAEQAQQEAEAKEAARLVTLAKLEALGLTAEDLAAL